MHKNKKQLITIKTFQTTPVSAKPKRNAQKKKRTAITVNYSIVRKKRFKN